MDCINHFPLLWVCRRWVVGNGELAYTSTVDGTAGEVDEDCAASGGSCCRRIPVIARSTSLAWELVLRGAQRVDFVDDAGEASRCIHDHVCESRVREQQHSCDDGLGAESSHFESKLLFWREGKKE